MAVGDIFRYRVVTYANDQVAVNVFHYRVSAFTGTQATALQQATQFDTLYAATLKAPMSANANYRGIGVQRIFPLPVQVEGTAVAGAGVGTLASNLMARQTAGLLTKRTAAAGRKYRGRYYVPFPAVSQSDANGIPVAGYVTLIGAIGTMLAAIQTVPGVGGNTTLVPIIWHRATNTYDDLTLVQTSQKWATQRRRGSYGRTNVLPF